jgi:hypothetical protein
LLHATDIARETQRMERLLKAARALSPIPQSETA